MKGAVSVTSPFWMIGAAIHANRLSRSQRSAGCRFFISE